MRAFRIRLLVLALFAGLGAWGRSEPVRADGFLSVWDDLPLAPGLAEMNGSAVSFDTPRGRIAETYAQGKVAAGTVNAFYAATLPQLGWTAQADGSYRRDTETLRLETTAGADGVVVHFALSPE
jgi:hypothetical protein